MNARVAASNQRWALSFADLCLLLVGFLLLVQAHRASPAAVVAGLRVGFGATPMTVVDRNAAALFEPGEAILTATARADLARIGAGARAARIVVESHGRDGGGRRFDGWELAAARTAAVSRAIAAGGLDPARIDLSVAPASEAAAGGQKLRITTVRE